MDLKQFGEELSTLRKEAGWSQAALLEALEQLAHAGPPSEYRAVDGNLLSRWEHARMQKGRQWRPTRTYTTYLIRLFVPYLDMRRAQQWAAQAGYTIQEEELRAWFSVADAAQSPSLTSQDLPQEFPHNLPPLLTTFIGREEEIARVVDDLSSANARLLTIAGEGGVGKTRLALQVAQRVVTERIGPFVDGVYFVPLAGATTPNSVLGALAEALAVRLDGVNDPEQHLLSYLRRRHLLLVLDNFEQLVTTVTPLVTAILQTTGAVHLLVTSRLRLNLAEEWVVALAGLPFMPSADAVEGDAAASSLSAAERLTTEYGAFRLFVTRARQVDAHFSLKDDPQRLAAVVRICELLQGIPLGIEMAAAWVHMLSCVQIADQISRNLDFLTSPHRNAPARHRSMRAIFEHSWRLLSAEEQAELAALAPFRGSFTLEAAVSVAQGSMFSLRSLVDKSLLTYQAGRFEVHELLRQFAEEQLQVQPAGAALAAQRHSDYYLRFVGARELRLAGIESHLAAAEIAAEFSNIYQAWRWAATQLRLDEINDALYALWRYFLLNGSSREGKELFGMVVDRIRAEVDRSGASEAIDQITLARPLYIKLLGMNSIFLTRFGPLQQALRMAEEALDSAEVWLQAQGAEPASDKAASELVLAFAQWVFVRVLAAMGSFERAGQMMESALQLVNRRLSDANCSELARDLAWQIPVVLSLIATSMVDAPKARAHMQQALATCQASGMMRGQMTCLGNLGWMAMITGDYAAARRYYEEALPLSHAYGYRLEEAANLAELGNTLRLQGDYGRALQLLEQGWRLAQELHAFVYAGEAAEAQAYLYTFVGDVERAQKWCELWRTARSSAEGEPELTIALLAFHQGATAHALEVAQRALHAARKVGLYMSEAAAQVLIGHIHAAMQAWDQAVAAYSTALAIYHRLNNVSLAAEARAGLAAVALDQNDLEAALQQVESILPVLESAPYVGIDEPFYTYWVCYQVLQSADDPRAAPLLERAYRNLERYAAHIGDASLRSSFWENVAVHRDLRAAFREPNPFRFKQVGAKGSVPRCRK